MNSQKNANKFLLFLIAITLLALAVRLYAGWQMYQHVPSVKNPSSQTDMHTYIQYGEKFANGTYTEHGGAYYYQPFYYAVFLRFLFTIFGSDTLVIAIAQAILGAFTVFLVGVIAAKFGGKKAGLIAASILLLFRNHILYTPFALIEILQAFLLTLTFYLILIAFKKKKLWLWAITGTVLACSILSRGNLLLLVPFILIFIWRTHRPGIKNILLPMTVFLLSVYLPQLPFSWKNYQVTSKWCGPSTAGDIVFAIGNNPDAPPGTENLPNPHYIIYDDYSQVNHWIAKTEEGALRQENRAWLRTNFLQWLELKFRTFSLYISNHECWNNITLAEVVTHVPWLNSYFLFDFWLVAIPFLVFMMRMVIFRKFQKQKMNFLLLTIIVYSASIIVFYVLSRYKVPIIPLLSVVAGIEFSYWSRVIKSENKKLKLSLAGLFLLSTFLVFRWFDIYQNNFQSKIAGRLFPEGHSFSTKEAIYLKDSGHPHWGNWQAEIITQNAVLNKKFYTNEKIAGNSGVCRLYLGVEEETVISASIQTGEKISSKSQLFKAGSGGWIEVPLTDIFCDQNGFIELKINLSANREFEVYFTDLKNNNRSSINGEIIDGEWIIQLKILK